MAERAVFDVAVIGCGPVGVMTALRCVQRGLSVVAIDASTELFPHPRAIALDDEGARLFHSAGLAEVLAGCSSPGRGAEFLDADGEQIVGFELPEGFVTPLGHPPMTMFEQPLLETGLRAAAADAGVDIRLGVEATALSLQAEGEASEVTTTDGPINARWIVGADGASSWVRKTLGIAIEDQGYDQPWLVVDTTLLDPELELPAVAQQLCDPARITTFVPGHGTRRRWEFRLHDDETRDDMNDPARVAELLAPWGSPDQLQIDRSAVYRFHALVAERFRVGPVFLAGDSAHQMPPFNGQGMNSGIRDAENLSWKLALVAEDAATDALLDTYEVERRPHAVDTVDHTCDAGRLIDAIASGIDVRKEDGYGGGRPRPFIKQGLVTGEHPAVGRPLAAPTAGESGDAIPIDELCGSGFALLHDGGASMPGPLERLGARSVTIGPGTLPFGLGEAAQAVIVRPDRIVAAVATNDELATVAHTLFDGIVAGGPSA
ncbi:MAG: bifunctional 3-(3-hydroxy-phenyl)propionate/3-hydroxycinnamic acid hydroxylase [Actinomycetota bacterium]